MGCCDARRLRPLVAILAYAAALLLVAISVLEMVLRPPTPRLICQRVLLIVLAAKLVLCQAGWPWLLHFFPYMRKASVRGLFVVFCGSLLIDAQARAGVIMGAVAMGLGVLLAVFGLWVDLRG